MRPLLGICVAVPFNSLMIFGSTEVPDFNEVQFINLLQLVSFRPV